MGMMMKDRMQWLKCLYTRSLLDGFVHRELSPGRRRYVGRHLDSCEDCYREYLRLSRISHELEARLAGLGAPSTNSVNRIWADVQQHLTQPVPSRNRRSMQISLASIGLLALTVLPSVLSGTAVSAAPTLPTQPRAHISQVVSTMTPATSAREIEYLRATETPLELVDVLRNTPESYATPR